MNVSILETGVGYPAELLKECREVSYILCFKEMFRDKPGGFSGVA